MQKHNQNGGISGVTISLIFVSILLVGAVVFGFWAFSGRQDFKDNTDAKIALAVEQAKKDEAVIKQKQYDEYAKQPLRTYNGPEAYGSIVLKYPKTWSGTVDDTTAGTNLVDGFFYPNIVPSITDPNSVFALRLQVVNRPYDQVLKSYSGQTKSSDPKRVPVTISAYALPKVPKVVGARVTGTLSDKQNKLVNMVVLPLRSETLEIWTEGAQFGADFENNILANFTFSP